MVEAAVRAGHARRHADAGPLQCCLHVARQASNDRRLPARIDEFMRELQVANSQIARDRFDQIGRLGKSVHQRVGVE